jgi:hypothetical protein
MMPWFSNKEPPPGSKLIKQAKPAGGPASRRTRYNATKLTEGRLTETFQEQVDRKMKHVSYLGYVITGTAKNEKSIWQSHVIVTWYAGKFDLHDESSFTTETEAEEHAIQLGKHWVNDRLQSIRGAEF